MSKGICCAGNMITDITYPIERWPRQGELTHITGEILRSTGGSACNTVIDLARLDPSLRLIAAGTAGHDENGDFILKELRRYKNIDVSMVKREGQTPFTAVMSNSQTKERTFFYHAGASARYGEEDIEWEKLDVDILHIGYLLLLPQLDEPDEIYGTRMARLLHRAKRQGLRTSIDVVSEAGDRFRRLALPALKYTDYCIINELEAQQITGVALRSDSGGLYRENLKCALESLLDDGVGIWAVIHCPELGCGMDREGNYVEMPSLSLPSGYIKGTVGAGDAFCAGVLYGAEMKKGLREAIEIGNCSAAASLHSAGASEGVGTAEEVLRLGKRYGVRDTLG